MASAATAQGLEDAVFYPVYALIYALRFIDGYAEREAAYAINFFYRQPLFGILPQDLRDDLSSHERSQPEN